MNKDGQAEITDLLLRWSGGDKGALPALIPAVYDELRRRASACLHREHPGHTLETSALVHEAFLRLMDQKRVDLRSRAQFFFFAGQLMRRILVDHARRRRCARRGGGALRLSLDDAPQLPAARVPDLLELDDALARLERAHPQQARIVELRYFAGYTGEEIAGLLGISVATVTRRWRLARAWLYRHVGAGKEHRS